MEDEQRRKISVEIGGRIRDRRRRLGLTEAELADYLGISLRQMRQYEEGDESPSCDELLWICLFLDCSADELCGTPQPRDPWRR